MIQYEPNNITVTLTDDMTESVIQQEMQYQIDSFSKTLYEYEDPENTQQMSSFHVDAAQDIEEIKRHIDAFRLVRNWYSVVTS